MVTVMTTGHSVLVSDDKGHDMCPICIYMHLCTSVPEIWPIVWITVKWKLLHSTIVRFRSAWRPGEKHSPPPPNGPPLIQLCFKWFFFNSIAYPRINNLRQGKKQSRPPSQPNGPPLIQYWFQMVSCEQHCLSQKQFEAGEKNISPPHIHVVYR